MHHLLPDRLGGSATSGSIHALPAKLGAAAIVQDKGTVAAPDRLEAAAAVQGICSNSSAGSHQPIAALQTHVSQPAEGARHSLPSSRLLPGTLPVRLPHLIEAEVLGQRASYQQLLLQAVHCPLQHHRCRVS